jgi:SAM-dependent methyltransferase
MPAALAQGGVWADLGAGSGAFTLALRELIGPGASLFAVDLEANALRALEREHLARFGSNDGLVAMHADFSAPLKVPPLDGILMANSLHFFKDKRAVLRQVRAYLKPQGILLLVEYNVDAGNRFVPYPLSFTSWRALAPTAGFSEPRLLGTLPSRFLKEFYSALAYRTEAAISF